MAGKSKVGRKAKVGKVAASKPAQTMDEALRASCRATADIGDDLSALGRWAAAELLARRIGGRKGANPGFSYTPERPGELTENDLAQPGKPSETECALSLLSSAPEDLRTVTSDLRAKVAMALLPDLLAGSGPVPCGNTATAPVRSPLAHRIHAAMFEASEVAAELRGIVGRLDL